MSTPGRPRFSNPHHLIQQSELVSRAVLVEDGITAGSERYHDSKEHAEEIRTLEEFFKSNLGDIMERPRKRRKIDRKEEVNVAEPLGDVATVEESNVIEPAIASSFRLVGSTLPPRPICLDPPPVPERILWEPPCEDTDGEAEERASKAASIAVDFSWLITESKKSYTPRPNEERKVLSAHAHHRLSADPPALVLFEHPKGTSGPTLSPTSTPAAEKEPHSQHPALNPSPHEPKLHSSFPTVQLNSTISDYSTPTFIPSSSRKCLYRSHSRLQLMSSPNKATRKNSKGQHHRQRKSARFWRPIYGCGGKSPGYAMGYEGSSAIDADDDAGGAYGGRTGGYIRDRMKKGVQGEVWGSGFDSGWR